MRQPVSGGKANGGTPKAVAKAKSAAAKPAKPAKAVTRPNVRQAETSTSAKYRGTPKVSQTTIDSIKKMGMDAALKKAGSSKNAEYVEGVRRMYGAKRLASAQGANTAARKSSGLSGVQKRAIKRGM